MLQNDVDNVLVVSLTSNVRLILFGDYIRILNSFLYLTCKNVETANIL